MATQSRRTSVLTFGDRCPRIWDGGCSTPVDMDVVIAFHASQGAREHRYKAPDRAPLHAINGRPC